MSTVLRIQETETDDVTDAADVVFAAKDYAWTARVVADVPVFVKIGIDAEATDEDLYINEFEECLLAVGADEEVAVLGTDVGIVWVTEVRRSS